MTIEDWKFINTFAPWLSAIGTLLVVMVSLYLAHASRRQKLKVNACIMQMLTVGQKEDVYPEYVWLRVVNIGHTKVKITHLGWNIGFVKKRTFLQKTPKHLQSSDLPISIDEGEEAEWFIDINDNDWMKDFYENTLRKNLWNLWSLRFVIYTSKGKSFTCKIDKSFRDEIKKIAESKTNKIQTKKEM